MTETLSATTARNFIGGEWSESESGETYEKRNPWRPDEVTGVYAASTADDAIAAVEAARRGIPRLGRTSGPGAGRVLLQGRRRDRGARRADRAGHDRRDGEAAARGADGVRAGRGDPPLLGRRGLPARRRGVRAVGREPDALHAPAPARRRRPDHAVELPGRDPRVEARTGAHLREHGRAQARLRGAAHGPPHRGVLRRGRAARPACSTSSRARARRSERSSSRTATCARSRSPARSPSATRCETRRRRATAASSSSSAATTRSS